MRVYFSQLLIGQNFEFGSVYWVKHSSCTAKIAKFARGGDRVFFFGDKDLVRQIGKI